MAGFSTSGDTALDLDDIAFVSPSAATFSLVGSDGILTVTDGTHTARLTLTGAKQLLGTDFIASSDGHGGVTIIDTENDARPAVAHFVAAMAGLSGGAAGPIHGAEMYSANTIVLARPRVAAAWPADRAATRAGKDGNTPAASRVARASSRQPDATANKNASQLRVCVLAGAGKNKDPRRHAHRIHPDYRPDLSRHGGPRPLRGGHGGGIGGGGSERPD